MPVIDLVDIVRRKTWLVMVSCVLLLFIVLKKGSRIQKRFPTPTLTVLHARSVATTDYYDTYDLIPFLVSIEQLFLTHAVR